MDTDKLTSFYRLVKFGSFPAVAHLTGLSESAIRRQIQTLEKEIGHALFVNVGQRLILTPKGKIFHDYAQRILNLCDESIGALTRQDGFQHAPLRIQMTQSMGSLYALTFIRKCHEWRPDLVLDIVCDDRVPDFRSGMLDLAIAMTRIEGKEKLSQRLLTRFEMGLFASETYVAQRGLPESCDDLAHHSLIGYPERAPWPYENINWFLHTLPTQKPLHPHVLVNNGAVVLELIEAGMGIGSISQKGLSLASSKLIPVLPAYPGPVLDVYLIYPSSIFEPVMMQKLFRILEDVMNP